MMNSSAVGTFYVESLDHILLLSGVIHYWSSTLLSTAHMTCKCACTGLVDPNDVSGIDVGEYVLIRMVQYHRKVFISHGSHTLPVGFTNSGSGVDSTKPCLT